jgi:hypothetical protein
MYVHPRSKAAYKITIRNPFHKFTGLVKENSAYIKSAARYMTMKYLIFIFRLNEEGAMLKGSIPQFPLP